MPIHPSIFRPVRLVLAVGLAAALGLSACAGAEDVDDATFASDLQERTTIPQPVADCLTEKIYAEYDQAEVNRIYRAATQTELDDDVRAKLSEFNAACFEAEAPAEGEDEGATTTSAPDDEGSPTTATEPG